MKGTRRTLSPPRKEESACLFDSTLQDFPNLREADSRSSESASFHEIRTILPNPYHTDIKELNKLFIK